MVVVEIIISSRRQANIFPVQLGVFELVNVSVDCYESSTLHIGYCTKSLDSLLHSVLLVTRLHLLNR